MTDFLYKLLAIAIKPLTLLGLREDLAKHVVVCFVIANVVMPFGGAAWALGTALTAALARETYNQWGPKEQRTGWSWEDIRASAFGALAGISGAATALLQLLF